MEEVFPPYHVFINHRGSDVKKTLASLIYHALQRHGLRVFLDKHELQVGDSLTPAIKSAISSASVQIAIFSKTYAQSAWCLDELVWMFDSHSGKVIPIFYDIQPWELRYVDKGAYAAAFQGHRDKGRVTMEQVNKWINALEKVAAISGVVICTNEDDIGARLEEIVEIVLKEVRVEELDVGEYPVGLHQAAEQFEKEFLNPSQLREINAVGIVGLGGSGKSTLVAHLYNSKCSQFQRCCFLSDVSKTDLPFLQQTLLRSLLRDQNLCVFDTHRGRSLLRDRLRGLTRVLIVFDNVDNTEQIDNLLFVKDILGNESLILVTSRDQNLFARSKIEIYNVKLLGARDAEELFRWHAFGHNKPIRDLQDMVEELVRMCGGFPLAVKVLAGQLHNESDPRKWKQHLESLRKILPKDVLQRMVMDSYESLDAGEKEAFLDIAHFFRGEDTDLVERVLDGLNDNGFLCLRTLRQKCLVEFESADITFPGGLQGAGVNWSAAVGRRTKGSLIIRMNDLVRDLARQIGRQVKPLRLCCSSDKMISGQVSGSHGSAQKYDVRGIRRDEDHSLPEFLQNQDICGLKLLAVQNFSILQKFSSLQGDLTWLRLCKFQGFLYSSPASFSSLMNVPSTLLLRSLRVLEVYGLSAQDFCNLFHDCEPPSQLCALEITCTEAFGSVSAADHSTSVSKKHGSVSKTLHSLQPQINLRHWFKEWLGKLNFKNVGKIVLQDIPGLQTLPIKFEEVINLRHVDLSGCSDLEYLPKSFTEELLHLQYLALRDCRKLVFQDLGKISTLEYLDFKGCSKLREMPKGTEVQKSLNYLNVVHTKLRELPQQLEQLEGLEELRLGSSELIVIPSSLYNLSGLTDLTLIGCTELLFIDNNIEKLVHLERFRMYNCGVRALPEKIASLNMKIIDVQLCPLDSEQLLTGVEPGNMPLDSSQAQGSTGQGAHPNRSGSLTDLIIRHSCILKIDIPQAESLFPKIEILDLSDNRLLKKIGRLPGNLTSLKLTNCSKLTTLACLSNLARLKVLDISGCGELRELNVESLRSIQVIKANGCWVLRNFQGLDRLEKLSCFQLSVFERYTNILSLRGYRFKGRGIQVLKEFDYSSEPSVEIKQCCFTDEKLEGAILLCLVTCGNCDIEVSFLGHTYTNDYSTLDNSVHILMWTKDSEVFNDFKFSTDKAIHFKFKVFKSDPYSTPEIQLGWIVQAVNGLDMSSFLSTFANSLDCIQ